MFCSAYVSTNPGDYQPFAFSHSRSAIDTRFLFWIQGPVRFIYKPDAVIEPDEKKEYSISSRFQIKNLRRLHTTASLRFLSTCLLARFNPYSFAQSLGPLSMGMSSRFFLFLFTLDFSFIFFLFRSQISFSYSIHSFLSMLISFRSACIGFFIDLCAIRNSDE